MVTTAAIKMSPAAYRDEFVEEKGFEPGRKTCNPRRMTASNKPKATR